MQCSHIDTFAHAWSAFCYLFRLSAERPWRIMCKRDETDFEFEFGFFSFLRRSQREMINKKDAEGALLIQEITEVSGKILNLTDAYVGQFIAVVSMENGLGDLGSLSKRISDPLASSTLLGESRITSLNFENGKSRNHFAPILSLKGGRHNYPAGLGILLSDGTFLAGGGSPAERNERGNLINFKTLSNVKVKKISAGHDHFLMLSKSGRVFSMLADGWEARNRGQLGTGDTREHFEPVEIRGIPKIQRIRAGFRSSLLVDEGGDLWVCGESGKFPFQDGLKKPTKIASGVRNVFSGFDSQTIFIQKTDGKILACGNNRFGQCGVGFATTSEPGDLTEWTEIEFAGENPLERRELKKISCSRNASFLLLSDGEVFSCGQQGECGFNKEEARFTRLETFEEMDERVLDVACGRRVSVFLTDAGRVCMTGDARWVVVRNILDRLGRKLQDLCGEIFWQVAWANKEDAREKLRRKISEGRKFKISVWQYEKLNIFITEHVDEEIDEIHRKFEKLRAKLDERILKLSDFVENLGAHIEEMNKEIEEKDKQNDAILGMLREKDREIDSLRKETTKIVSKTAETSELFTLIRSFNVFLVPLNTVRELKNSLSLFDCSDGERKNPIFEFYEASADPREFESGEQRAAVGKITDILKIYKVLKESPQTKKYFEFASTKIKFESIDRVYSDFFKCLNLAKNSEKTPDVFSLLDSLFRYFGVLDFDLNSLASVVSSLSDSLIVELQKTGQKLTESLKKSSKRVPEFPASEGEIEKYLKSFGDDGTFFEKFSFLVLVVLSRFTASLSKEVLKPETQKLLSEAIRNISDYHWNELRLRAHASKNKESGRNTPEKLLESLKSVYRKMIDVEEKVKSSAGRRETSKYSKMLVATKENLKNILSSFLAHRIVESKPTDERILKELLGVFRPLGAIKGTPKSEEVAEVLEVDFDLELDELRVQLSGASESLATSGDLCVIGFKNSEMVSSDFFYDYSGKLKEKYSEIPNIEGRSGKPLTIFIKFYAKEEISPRSVQIEFVHLFSGESFRLNYPGCMNSTSLEIKELRDWNTFQITISDLKYSGEFALVASLNSDSLGRQTFFHRGIFNEFPRRALPNDF